jgi:hypothetical protein
MIGAKSQAVLNTFIEHDFHDAFKNGRSAGNGAYVRKWTIRRLWWPVGPKLAFDQTAAPILEIMDISF